MRTSITATPRSSPGNPGGRSIATPTTTPTAAPGDWPGALQTLGASPDTRVGTLAWNTHRHFELYYGVAGSGAVLNTINPRLFPEQVQYIISHAEDEILFFDIGFASLVEQIAPQCATVRHWVALCDPAHPPVLPFPALCYEDLIASVTDAFEWPTLDKNAACVLCYTSGTTGNPKGAMYSHRSTILHAFAMCLPDAMNLSARDAILPVVPMFHVNAWGLPYAAALVGAKLVLPGAQLDGPSLHALMEQEGSPSVPGCRRSGWGCCSTCRPPVLCSPACDLRWSEGRPVPRRSCGNSRTTGSMCCTPGA